MKVGNLCVLSCAFYVGVAKPNSSREKEASERERKKSREKTKKVGRDRGEGGKTDSCRVIFSVPSSTTRMGKKNFLVVNFLSVARLHVARSVHRAEKSLFQPLSLILCRKICIYN